MFLQDLKKKIEHKISNSTLSKVLFSRFKTGFDKPVLLFSDPSYLPMYYYLGKFLGNSRNLLEFGFDLGMPSGCFMEGCRNVENFTAFKKGGEIYHSKRLGIANIHNIFKKKFDLWIGDEIDPEFLKLVFTKKWDCVIIADNGKKEQTYRAYMDLIWDQMMHGGVMVVDFMEEAPVKAAYESFCKSQNRTPLTVNTLRGTGFLQR